jgi:aspartyl-tRNA(Asn)/glutamyl-tRNA(Gln) amidotransferase subunit C
MISKEDILKLAELARIQLSDEEVASLQKDMTTILDYVGQVQAAAQEDQKTAPLVHNVMREDMPRSENDILTGKRESLLSALPKREGDYAVVRKIIQKDE